MNQDSQQDNNVETQTSDSNTTTSSTREMYNQACDEIQGLPTLGKIALAVCIIIVLFKATPLLDLVWLFIQIVVIPCLLLIALGCLSHETYMLFIGWLNESLVWCRKKRDEISNAGS